MTTLTLTKEDARILAAEIIPVAAEGGQGNPCAGAARAMIQAVLVYELARGGDGNTALNTIERQSGAFREAIENSPYGAYAADPRFLKTARTLAIKALKDWGFQPAQW